MADEIRPAEAKELSDDQIADWAKAIALQGAIDIGGFKALQEYRGTKLTPENSAVQEARYLDDLEAEGKAWMEQGEKRTEADWQREVYKRELYCLAKWALGFEKFEFYIHYPMAKWVQSHGPAARAHMQMPRATYKTSIFTISDSVRQILRNPEVRIQVRSHKAEYASGKMREAVDRMIESKELKRLFPELMPKKKADKGGLRKWICPARRQVHAEGTLNAAGAGQSNVGQHYDIIYNDDLWDAKSVKSIKALNAVREKVRQTKFFATDEHTSIFFVDTRWSHDDPTEILLKNPEYRHLIVSAIDSQGKSIFVPLKPGGGGYTLRKLHAMWHEGAYDFSTQMMQGLAAAESGFQEKWLQQYVSYQDVQREQVLGNLKLVNIGLVDLAGTKGDQTDFNCLLVLTMDSLGRKLITAAWLKRDTPFEFAKFVFEQNDRWKLSHVVLQKAPVESLMRPHLDNMNTERIQAGQRAVNWVTYGLTAERGSRKLVRIGTLKVPFERGEIWFNSDGGEHTEGIEQLRKQLKEFPYSQTDDGPDALSMINDPKICWHPKFDKPPPGPPTGPLSRKEIDDAQEQARRASVAAAFAEQETQETEP